MLAIFAPFVCMLRITSTCSGFTCSNRPAFEVDNLRCKLDDADDRVEIREILNSLNVRGMVEVQEGEVGQQDREQTGYGVRVGSAPDPVNEVEAGSGSYSKVY